MAMDASAMSNSLLIGLNISSIVSLRACLKSHLPALKAQPEGSQTCNVWDTIGHPSRTEGAGRIVLALLQSAHLLLDVTRRCTCGLPSRCRFAANRTF